MSMDLHIIHTIKNSLKYFAENQTIFNGCFPQISTTIRNKYFTRLGVLINEIQLDTAFTRKTNKIPLISISLTEAQVEQTTFLGNQGVNGELTQLSNQQCRISIYSKSMDDIRILHRLIQCGLLMFKKSFFDIQYLDLRYVQSKDLEPIEMLTSDNVVVYVRELIYMSTSEISVKEILSDEVLDWVVSPNLIKGGFSSVKTQLAGTNIPQIPNNPNLPLSTMDETQPFVMRFYNNHSDKDLYVKWENSSLGKQLVIIKTTFNTTTLLETSRYIPAVNSNRLSNFFNTINVDEFNNSPDSQNNAIGLRIADLITETLGSVDVDALTIGLGDLDAVIPVVSPQNFIRVRPGEFFDIK
jgi:hypothetical protein